MNLSQKFGSATLQRIHRLTCGYREENDEEDGHPLSGDISILTKLFYFSFSSL